MIIYFDLSSGASGDKLLASLLQLSEETNAYSLGALQRELAEFAPEARISLERVTRGGLSGRHLRVDADEAPRHRRWSDIREKLTSSSLSAGAITRALATFELLANVEARAHDISCEEVHFHEIGATDSLVDVIGTSILLDVLHPKSITCSPIAVGYGTVDCSHGTLPLPAPAVAEILRGAPLFAGAALEESELTTPTGAALIMTNVDTWGPMPQMTVSAIGYGAGTREIAGIPNILRVISGEAYVSSEKALLEKEACETEGLLLLSTNIDHITAEEIAFAVGELLEAGALDVWQEPISMKKGRLGVKVVALVRPSDTQKITSLFFRLTGTLGVRSQWVERTFVPREVVELDTPYGPCSFKVATIDGEKRMRPEHEDVARLAREHDLPYRVVSEQLRKGLDALGESGE